MAYTGTIRFLPLRTDVWLATGPSFYFDRSGEMQYNAARNSLGARPKALLKSQPVNRSAVHYTRPLNPQLAVARGDI